MQGRGVASMFQLCVCGGGGGAKVRQPRTVSSLIEHQHDEPAKMGNGGPVHCRLRGGCWGGVRGGGGRRSCQRI
jgi:hypothetical protein